MPFLALGAGSLASGVSGIFGSLLASNTEQNAETQVQDLLKQLTPQELSAITGGVSGATSALGNQYNENLGLLAPYLSTGTGALAQLNRLTAGGGFKPPTAADAAAQPGYQFQLQQGELGLNQSAAAAGGALSGGAIKAAEQYGQGLASTDYNNVYNQALGTYQTNSGNLQALANLGASATNTGVQSGNLLSSQSAADTLQGGLSTASTLGQNFGSAAGAITGSANASAAGTIGASNAFGSTASGLGSNVSNLLLLQNLLGGSGVAGGGGSSYTPPVINPNSPTYANP